VPNFDVNRHNQRFTTLCKTVRQEGVPDDWFKWNLFPYSLADEPIKWYSFASFEVKGNWDHLIKHLCQVFSYKQDSTYKDASD
jgi:hypothetical protein